MGARALAARALMSEYQCYEFRAIHRALTDRQMRELRAISTRAAISHTSFSNYYTFGDLKANPRDLLVKYCDASLYFAHWLFLELAFRYPKGAVDVRALRRYTMGQTIEVRSTAQHVVVAISVESDGDSFDTADDASGWLSSLIRLRADLASGDDRVLYLGWLLDVQSGEIDDNAVEPARPDGARQPHSNATSSSTLSQSIAISWPRRGRIPVVAAIVTSRHRAMAGHARYRRASRCSPVSLAATLVWGPNSRVGFVCTRAIARPPCPCAQPANCVLEQKRPQRGDARQPESVRLACVRLGSGRRKPHVMDI
jgi:hypothetical protein